MIGYILNDVTWCGSTATPGINFDSCPAFASCPNHVMASFWAKALETVNSFFVCFVFRSCNKEPNTHIAISHPNVAAD